MPTIKVLKEKTLDIGSLTVQRLENHMFLFVSLLLLPATLRHLFSCQSWQVDYIFPIFLLSIYPIAIAKQSFNRLGF